MNHCMFQMGAAFTPYLPHCGGCAGIMGQLAALTLELAQSWKLVRHPWFEAIKLAAIVMVMFISGY